MRMTRLHLHTAQSIGLGTRVPIQPTLLERKIPAVLLTEPTNAERERSERLQCGMVRMLGPRRFPTVQFPEVANILNVQRLTFTRCSPLCSGHSLPCPNALSYRLNYPSF